MKEESARHKQEQEKRSRELAQLRKANRKHENQIRTLEADRRAKDVVLRRRQEEVSALRRNQYSSMSNKAAGRPVGVRKGGSTSPTRSNSISLSKDLRRAERSLYRGVAVMQASRKLQSFSPKAAKQKWSLLEKNINQVCITKQTVTDLEKQMDR
jgi:kinesin family protein 4/21/27